MADAPLINPTRPVPFQRVADFCESLGYDPRDVAEIELVLVEPRQVTVQVRPAADRRATVTHVHPVQ